MTLQLCPPYLDAFCPVSCEHEVRVKKQWWSFSRSNLWTLSAVLNAQCPSTQWRMFANQRVERKMDIPNVPDLFQLGCLHLISFDLNRLFLFLTGFDAPDTRFTSHDLFSHLTVTTVFSEDLTLNLKNQGHEQQHTQTIRCIINIGNILIHKIFHIFSIVPIPDNIPFRIFRSNSNGVINTLFIHKLVSKHPNLSFDFTL